MHALIRSQMVETAHTAPVGTRITVLTIKITSCTSTDLPRDEVMNQGGVIIAVEPTGLVIGMFVVEFGTRHIETVKCPVECQSEGFSPREHGEVGQGIGVGMTVLILSDHLEKHAVGLRLKALHRQFQGIGGQPVVGIHHTDIPSFRPLQSLVPGMGLSLVLRQTHHLDSGILPGILLEQVQGAVGRGIIDTDHLDSRQRLLQQ